MFRRFLILGCISLVLFSCKREDRTEWDVDALFPLAKAHLTISDLIPDSLITTSEDGLVYLRYEENLTDLDLDSLVQIPDTVIHESFSTPLTVSIDPGQFIPFSPVEENLNVENAQLKEIETKSGFMNFVIRNYIEAQLNVTFGLPGVALDGVDFSVTEVLEPAENAVPGSIMGQVDLSGYHFDLAGESGAEFNTVVTALTVQVDEDTPGPIDVGIADSLTIEISFNEAAVSYARGFFGNHDYSIQDTLNLDVMQSIVAGDLDIGEIDFSLEIDNFVGADAQFLIKTLGSFNSGSNSTVELTNDDLLDEINITRAFDAGWTVVPTEYDLALEELNSNIDEFVENLPDRLTMDIDVEVNPLGNVSDGNDFIYTAQPLEAVMTVEMPLCISASSLMLNDTLEITSESAFEATGNLFVYADNGFLFEAVVQLELINNNLEHVADLFSEPVLSPGIYDDISESVVPQSSVLELSFTENEVHSFEPGNFLVLTVEFNTIGEEEVKINTDNFLDIKIVADVTGKVGYN
jgi:hypothetical protein